MKSSIVVLSKFTDEAGFKQANSRSEKVSVCGKAYNNQTYFRQVPMPSTNVGQTPSSVIPTTVFDERLVYGNVDSDVWSATRSVRLHRPNAPRVAEQHKDRTKAPVASECPLRSYIPLLQSRVVGIIALFQTTRAKWSWRLKVIAAGCQKRDNNGRK